MIKKRVIVTGADGQVGSALRTYVEQTDEYDFIFLTRTQLDLAYPRRIQQYFSDIKADWLIHCAAYTAVDRAEDEPSLCFDINARATQLLAEACATFGLGMIYVSTDYVFDGKKNEPYTEDDTALPLSTYGESKLMGEAYVKHVDIPQCIILRTSGVYSGTAKGFFRTIRERATDGEPLSVVDDQQTSPTPAIDVAAAIMHLISRVGDDPVHALYHYACLGSCSWYEFAEAILSSSGINTSLQPITTEQYGAKAPRPAYSVLSSDDIIQRWNVPIRHWRVALAEVCRSMDVL